MTKGRQFVKCQNMATIQLLLNKYNIFKHCSLSMEHCLKHKSKQHLQHSIYQEHAAVFKEHVIFCFPTSQKRPEGKITPDLYTDFIREAFYSPNQITYLSEIYISYIRFLTATISLVPCCIYGSRAGSFSLVCY